MKTRERRSHVPGRWLVAWTLGALAGCATPVERIDRRATDLGLRSAVIRGEAFDHRSYFVDVDSREATLRVYIEHDGTPWTGVGRIADDPTPRTPYALEMMGRDRGARLLLGRPCYFGRADDDGCTPLVWTHDRYSEPVVASMAAALRRFLAAHEIRRVVLVGYSGGGTLAWLVAARVPETIGVVTIAANLDIDEWARIHDFSPLAGSLNPALEAPLRSSIDQLHLVGGRDTNVPPEVVWSFARRHTGARVLEFARFDHRCCWIDIWPQPLAAPGIADGSACRAVEDAEGLKAPARH